MDEALLFWTKAAAIGQIAGALATAAAVTVSLWIVFTERREDVRFTVSKKTLIDQVRLTSVIAFEVINTGVRPIRVEAFGWRSGWLRRRPSWAAFRLAYQPPDAFPGSGTPPFNLAPGERGSMYVRMDAFQAGREADEEIFGMRTVPLIGPRMPPIFAQLHTSRGKVVLARLEARIAAELLSGAKADPAA